MKLDAKIVKQVSPKFNALFKQDAQNLIDNLKEHINKYGAICCKDIDIYQRTSVVLSEFIPGYGDFVRYLSIAGGDTSASEYGNKVAALRGAIIFLQQNGFVLYSPGEILTHKPLKEQTQLKPKKIGKKS